jgi:uncharacterized protein (TIGR00106 family)
MTAIAELSVVPVRTDGMAGEIAKAVDALEAFDVTYEVGPMGTVVEAADASELFAAAAAAHDAVDEDRVITTLKVDDTRTVDRRPAEKVAAVAEQREDDGD